MSLCAPVTEKIFALHVPCVELLPAQRIIACMATWHDTEIPQYLRNANIVTIYKKGDNSDCGKCRGIVLLFIVGKIPARALLNCLLPLTEDILFETQCGFRPFRGTTDLISLWPDKFRRNVGNKIRNYSWPLLT